MPSRIFSIRCATLWLFVVIMGCSFHPTYAQSTVKTDRILILLDASLSMNQKWNDSMSRYNAATAVINTLIDSVYNRNDEVEFALRGYGQQSSSANNDCLDTKLEVMFSRDNATQMELRLASLRPRGISNTAFAIEEAVANDIANVNRYNYSIVILTDGGESCGNEICAVATKLKSKLPPVCIVSLTEYANTKNEYECLGRNIVATQHGDIAGSVKRLLATCCNIPYRKKAVIKDDSPLPQIAKTIPPPSPKRIIQQPATTAPDSIKAIPKTENTPPPRKSKIVVANDEIGYLKLAGNISLAGISLYIIVDDGYKSYNKQLVQDEQKRIELPEGTYRMVFTKVGQAIYKDFKIVPGMITEVGL